MPDLDAIKKQAEAATVEHRELEAIPKSVCLGCGAIEEWPCDAVGLAADCTALVTALEEAQEEARKLRHWARDFPDQRVWTHIVIIACDAILGESE